MGGVDEVVREWLCHVLIHCLMLGINDWIIFASKKAETRERGRGEREGCIKRESELFVPYESSKGEKVLACSEICWLIISGIFLVGMML